MPMNWKAIAFGGWLTDDAVMNFPAIATDGWGVTDASAPKIDSDTLSDYSLKIARRILPEERRSWGQLIELLKVFFTFTNNITASQTQTQGYRELTATLNIVTDVVSTNDVVTMTGADKMRVQIIVNAGGNTLQVYPDTGDSIDGGAANASTTQADGVVGIYFTCGDTKWYSVRQ